MPNNVTNCYCKFFYMHDYLTFYCELTSVLGRQEGFSLLYDVIPFVTTLNLKCLCVTIENLKLKKSLEKRSTEKKSFEISTALVLQMKILEFSPKCINFFFCNFKVKKRCIEFSCLCVLPSVWS